MLPTCSPNTNEPNEASPSSVFAFVSLCKYGAELTAECAPEGLSHIRWSTVRRTWAGGTRHRSGLPLAPTHQQVHDGGEGRNEESDTTPQGIVFVEFEFGLACDVGSDAAGLGHQHVAASGSHVELPCFGLHSPRL